MLNSISFEFLIFFEKNLIRKDVRRDVSYIFLQSNFENLSPIIFSELSCKAMVIDFENSPKIEFWFFEAETLYSYLRLHKDMLKIMYDKKY